MSHILYLSHNGMTEPLGQTQVLPYLRGVMAGRGDRLRVTLLACEPAETPAAQTAQVARGLAQDGIDYVALRRRPTARLLDKAGDSAALLLHGLRDALRRRERPRLVHARGQLPAAVGQALRAALPGARLIFDCRGLLADEYLDMGHWRRDDLRYRLTARAEASLLRRADRVVVLTQALRDELIHAQAPARRPGDVVHIPCCADTQRFRPDPQARARARAALALREDEVLLCFAGSMARYDMQAALWLLRALRRQGPARLLLLTRADTRPVYALAAPLGLPADAVLSVAASPAEVPGWLAAGDLAAAFLQPWRSSIATSPTKIGEYLACGLPTALSAGISDGDRLRDPALFSAPPTDPAAVSALAARMLALLADRAAARDTARACAEQHFSLAGVGVVRYRALYQELLS